MKSRKLDKLIKFIRFCDDLSTLSACKRAQCGAIVFDWGFRAVFGIGYNGPASGMPNDSCSGEQGTCGCVHAETNALLKAGTGPRRDLAMYSTTYPCPLGAGLIANHGDVLAVFYKDQYREQTRSKEIFAAANIEVVHVSQVKVVEELLENL